MRVLYQRSSRATLDLTDGSSPQMPVYVILVRFVPLPNRQHCFNLKRSWPRGIKRPGFSRKLTAEEVTANNFTKVQASLDALNTLAEFSVPAGKNKGIYGHGSFLLNLMNSMNQYAIGFN